MDWYKNEVNPHGLVPSMVLPDGTHMIESAAICMYIADKYGRMLPEPEKEPIYYRYFFKHIKLILLTGLYLRHLQSNVTGYVCSVLLFFKVYISHWVVQALAIFMVRMLSILTNMTHIHHRSKDSFNCTGNKKQLCITVIKLSFSNQNKYQQRLGCLDY